MANGAVSPSGGDDSSEMPQPLNVVGLLALGGLLLSVGAAAPGRAEPAQAEPAVQSETCSVEILLENGEGWEVLRYSNIPANSVDFSPLGLHIQVDESAAPLVYPLSAPMAVARLAVRGRVDGELRVAPESQGEEGFDDYVFRAGLVISGNRRLGFFNRMFAPEWVKRLYALAPSNQGVSMVRFFNIGADPNQIGQQRVHPLSDLLEEEIVDVLRADGTFSLDVPLVPPVETLAVWLSSDGDDSESTFSVLVESITLSTVPAEPSGC